MSTNDLQGLNLTYKTIVERKDQLFLGGEPWRLGKCSVSSTETFPCLLGTEVSEYLAPFPASVLAREPEDFRSSLAKDVRPFWAPITEVKAGVKVLETLSTRARDRKPLRCKEESCVVLIHVPASPVGPSEGFAACEALFIHGTAGPPSDCVLTAISDGSQWWLRAVDASFPRARDLTNHMYMTAIYDVTVIGLPREAILTMLDIGLKALLPQRTIKVDRIWGSAPPRFSKVLSGGWFEWAQVQIELEPALTVRVSLDLLVNKQNTTEPSDWHLPTPQQQEEYASAVRTLITKALESSCLQPVWKGSAELHCTTLRTAAGQAVPGDVIEGALKFPPQAVQALDPRLRAQAHKSARRVRNY